MPPALKQLHHLLTKGLQTTAELWLSLEQAKAILTNESQDPGQQVRERYLAYLEQMRDGLPTLGQLAEAFEHFCHITDNFAGGLFWCYNIAGLPRTNNDLEHCFGIARIHGRGAVPRLVVRGPVHVMAAVKSRELVFSAEDLRRQLCQREEARRQQWCFRKNLTIPLMVLVSLMGSTLGLVLDTAVSANQISLIFSLILTLLLFTGCTYNPWISLSNIKWFQIVTLFNPLTYASEGLRAAMIPPSGGHRFPTLGVGWSLLGLCVATIARLIIGIWLFRSRIIN